MNPIRLIFGLVLVYFCIFGLPEGCLVLPSHAASPPPPCSDTECNNEIPLEWIGKQPLQAGSSLLHPQIAPSLPTKA